MGVRAHFRIDEAAELATHFFHRLVAETERAEVAGVETIGDQFGDAEPRGGCVGRDQLADRGRVQRRRIGAEVGRPHDLDLADGDAALQLSEIFAERHLKDELFQFATGVRLGPASHLADRRDIGRDPGEAMGRELFALQQLGIDLALGRDQLAHGFARDCLVGVGSTLGVGAEGKEVVQKHSVSPVIHSSPPRSGGEEGAHCEAMGR